MKIHVSYTSHWAEAGDTMICGNAFLDGTHLSNQELAERISTVDSKNELRSILSRLNGFFSVIHRTGGNTYVAVDHVRSWPLYYASTDDIYISDSAEWVHRNGAQRGYDPTAVNEYLFTCYITGKDTLSKDVKQIRSGELLTFDPDKPGTGPVTERYYRYGSGNGTENVDENEFDERLVESFQRLIEYADGRTILVGLSGGYDSRLIVLMLRRLGYDNTITYTTLSASGSPKEMEVAESIANDLDFRHIRITTKSTDYEHLDDSDQLDVVEDIGYLSEYPHINKLVLRQKLENEGIDPSDVVHVLGHQLVSVGQFLSSEIRNKNEVTRKEFFDMMWNLNYLNWIEQGDSRLRGLFESRMLDRIPSDLYEGTGTVEPVTDAVKGFEEWYWQERLPKYILARREYEYLGFDMWYPFLDRAVCSFYERCSYSDKVDRHILKEYIDDLDVQLRGRAHNDKSAYDTRSMSGVLFDQLVPMIHKLPEPITRSARQFYYKFLHDSDEYDDDPRYSIVSRNEFDSISFPVISYRTLLLLYLYDRGYFDTPVRTEFDIALETAPKPGPQASETTDSVHGTSD